MNIRWWVARLLVDFDTDNNPFIHRLMDFKVVVNALYHYSIGANPIKKLGKL